MTELTPAWFPLKYHPIQAALWTSTARFVANPAGRGAGKSLLADRRLVRFLPIQKPWDDPIYFYGAPTVEQAKRLAWNKLLKLIPKEWLEREPNKSELSIKTVFGSTIYVVGLDKPQRIEGVQWDGCVIDESSDIKPGTFDLSVLPALMHRNGWCWRIGVPKRHGIGASEFRKFYEDCAAGTIPEGAAYTWGSKEIVPESALALARAKMDPRDFDEQFNARFQNASGGIFYAFEKEYNVRPCAYHPEMPIDVGSDFNVNPMAWVLSHNYGQPPEHRMEVFDHLWLRDSNTPHALNVLKSRYPNHRGGWRFFGDATASSRKTNAAATDYLLIWNDADFKRMGRSVHYPKANPARADRFAATNALIKTADGRRRLFVDPHCMDLIDDLMCRAMKENSREPDDSGDVGHITDALGYIIHKLYPIRIPVEGRAEISVTGFAS